MLMRRAGFPTRLPRLTGSVASRALPGAATPPPHHSFGLHSWSTPIARWTFRSIRNVFSEHLKQGFPMSGSCHASQHRECSVAALHTSSSMMSEARIASRKGADRKAMGRRVRNSSGVILVLVGTSNLPSSMRRTSAPPRESTAAPRTGAPAPGCSRA